MGIKRWWHRMIVGILAVLLGLSGMVTAMAASDGLLIDPDQDGSLTIYFGRDGQHFSGVEFYLYRIADVSPQGAFTITKEFANYPVSLDDLETESDVRALASTLDAYIKRDNVKPLYTDETGSDGWARFPVLSTGLYLVCGEEYDDGEQIYSVMPTLICLPAGTSGDWDYDLTLLSKYEVRESTGETIRRRVLKVWDDDGNEASRPNYIVVQLLGNGEVVDTVVLSEQNNWEYTWEELDETVLWQVVERNVSDGYTVTVVQEGITFVVTNTKPPVEPGPSPSVPPDDQPWLPQTGMLQWPVLALVGAGGLLVVIGLVVVVRTRSDDDEK